MAKKKENRVHLQIYITNDQKFFLQKIAELQDRSVASYIRNMINNEMKKSKNLTAESEC